MKCIRLIACAAMAVVAGLPVSQARGELLVGSHNTSAILRYDTVTGASLGAFVPSGSGGLSFPHGFAFGPDGNFYVTGHQGAGGTVNDVFRYNGTTGAFLGVFIPAATSGLSFSDDLRFGPDGNLYIASENNHQVRRYNGTTGAFLNSMTLSSSSVPVGLAFGPDGNLYVSNQGTNDIARFDPSTGNSLGTFVPSGSGGLSSPFDITFGPDGNLYVANIGNNSVLRYNGSTGAFLGAFVTSGSGGLNTPTGLNFGPDGNLYVSSARTNSVLRYNGTTGAFLNTFVTAGSGGLDFPHYLDFTPSGPPAAVPEPASLTLAGAGLLGLLGYARRLRRRR